MPGLSNRLDARMHSHTPLRSKLEEIPEVRKHLDDAKLDEIFDLESYFRNLAPVFERVLATDWAQ